MELSEDEFQVALECYLYHREPDDPDPDCPYCPDPKEGA